MVKVLNILIDIGHPAHVHYFRNLYIDLKKGSNNLFVTCRSNSVAMTLMDHYGIEYIMLGSKGSTVKQKIIKQAKYTVRLKRICSDCSIDLAIGASPLIVHGAIMNSVSSIMFDDDDLAVQPLTARFVTPFADTILSPDALAHENTKKTIYYPGYHELAYLHPRRFTRDANVLAKYGLSIDDKYYVLRFNAFKAHHDVNEGGMSIEQKRKLVSFLCNYGKVFITSEANLDKEFERYQMRIDPADMHHFLAFAQMLVSDSQTMTSEAAVLGTPSFRCNSFAGRLSVLEEEEKKYKLTKAFLPRQFDWMMNEIKDHLHSREAGFEWEVRRHRMLKDKIDVTAFWIWFIEKYPDSISLIKSGKVEFYDFM